MRKKFNRNVGYYCCGRKGCKCNASTKKVNGVFEEWLDSITLPEKYYEVLHGQFVKALSILNKKSNQELANIRFNLTNKEKEIEKIEANLALATNAKIQEACLKQLEIKEAERDEILADLEDRGKELLNLNEYALYGVGLKDNLLKLWQIASLPRKRIIQELIFPDGIVWNKENEDIEPVSKNEFLFLFDLKSGSYEDKEKRQTDFSTDLSFDAPQAGLEPATP